MLDIIKKEFRSFFSSSVVAAVSIIFFCTLWLIIWILPEYSIINFEYASLDNLFVTLPFVLIVVIPAITMSSLADEKKNCTLYLLLNSQLSIKNLIIQKFLANYLFIALLLILTFPNYLIIYRFASPIGNVDNAAIYGGYIGVFLLAASFCSLSLIFTTITEKNIVALLLSIFACLILYQGLDSMKNLYSWHENSSVMAFFSMKYRYNSISKGLIDARDIVYFLSIIYLSLFFSIKLCKPSNK